MIKIFVIDDHAIVRQGLKQICADDPDIIVIDEAEDGLEALNKIRKNDYDVIILDISIPGMNGIELLKQVKAIKPGIRVLILTMHPEEQFALQAFKAGASGYLMKNSVPEELITAIHKIYLGKKYISRNFVENIGLYFNGEISRMPHELLSNREYEVLLMLAGGNAMKAIATELSLSVKTISTYRYRILEKMSMSNNAQLIRYVIQNQLV